MTYSFGGLGPWLLGVSVWVTIAVMKYDQKQFGGGKGLFGLHILSHALLKETKAGT